MRLRPRRLPRELSQLIVAVVYYPPNSPDGDKLIDHIQDTVDDLLTRYPEAGIAIVGDFNQLNIDPLIQDRTFKQVVTKPTRENAILDMIITNFRDRYSQPAITCPLGASDHNAIIWSPLDHVRKINQTRKRMTRPLRESNMRDFGSCITNCDWETVFNATTAENKANEFYSILNSLIDRFFPIRTVKMHCNDRIWMTPAIKALIKQRQVAFHKQNIPLSKTIGNRVRREIKKAKRVHYNDKIQKHKASNPAEWYKQIKKLTGSGSKTSHIHVPEVDPNDTKQIADIINSHFASVAADVPPLDMSLLPAFLPSPTPPPRIEPWEVYHKLKSVNVGKAGGPDMIPPRLIKEFACELSVPLSHIYSESLAEGTSPSEWKKAVVIPVPKTTPAVIDKLRPISLTDTFAKIFESFVAKWTLKDLFPNLDKRQFGNVHGLSTSHYLIDLLHTLFMYAENNKSLSDLILTDFCKAFDRIDHNVALKKLISYGAHPAVVRWIMDFLFNRKQCVRYRESTSDWVTLHAGVPQGTHLGPIIFLTVINDACQDSSLPYWKYVDDMSIVHSRSAHEPSTQLQTTMTEVQEWSSANGMTLNPTKCQIMQISFMKHPPPAPEIIIDGQILQETTHARVLGVHLQNDLKWTTHVNYMLQRANGRLYMLRLLKSHGLSLKDLCTIYVGYVRPLVEYACPVWNGGLTKQQILLLERVQKRALRIILGPMYLTYAASLSLFELPSLDERRKSLCLTFAKGLVKDTRLSHLIPQPKETGRVLRTTGVRRQQIRCRTERLRTSAIPYLTELLNEKNL